MGHKQQTGGGKGFDSENVMVFKMHGDIDTRRGKGLNPTKTNTLT